MSVSSGQIAWLCLSFQLIVFENGRYAGKIKNKKLSEVLHTCQFQRISCNTPFKKGWDEEHRDMK
jgi:hypothetical protein